MKVKEAIEALSKLPPERELMCQVVGVDGSAWNMQYEFCIVSNSDWLCQLRVFHPSLKTLPDIAWDDAPKVPTLQERGQFSDVEIAASIDHGPCFGCELCRFAWNPELIPRDQLEDYKKRLNAKSLVVSPQEPTG